MGYVLEEKQSNATPVAATMDETQDAARSRSRSPVQLKALNDPAPKATEGGDKDKDKKKAEDEERTAAVQAKWEGLLGKWLGSKLAPVVLEHVSVDALNGYVQDALKSAGPALGDALKKETDPTKAQEAALKAYSDALAGVLTGLVDKWVKSEGGQKVLTRVSEWTQDSPGAVMAIIGGAVIGGAVAAWFSNATLPEIKVPLNIGDWKIKGGIDLGKIQNLGFQGASLAFENKAQGIKLSGSVKKGDDKTTISAKGEAAIGADSLLKGDANVTIEESKVTVKLNGGMKAKVGDKTVELGGSYQKDGPITGKIKVAGAEGGYKEIVGTKSGDVVTFSTKDVFAGGNSVEHKYKQNADGSTTNTVTAAATVAEGHKLSATVGDKQNVAYEGKDIGGTGINAKANAGSDGYGAGVSYNEGGLKANADYANKGGKDSLKLGLGYDKGMLKSQLDFTMSEGKTSLGLKTSINTEGGFKFDGNLNLDDGHLKEVGVKLGYQNPDEFKGFLLGYKQTWLDENKGQPVHHFDAMLEYSMGRWLGRLEGGVDISGGAVTKTKLDLGLGYKLNKDWTLIGGVQAGGMMNQDTNRFEQDYKPYLGAQFGNIGVAGYYDSKNKGGGIMLTIPLGR